jgi:hypothetical protein
MYAVTLHGVGRFHEAVRQYKRAYAPEKNHLAWYQLQVDVIQRVAEDVSRRKCVRSLEEDQERGSVQEGGRVLSFERARVGESREEEESRGAESLRVRE